MTRMTTRSDHPAAGGGSIRKQVAADSLLAILQVAASRAERGSASGLGCSVPAAREPRADICKIQAKSARFLEQPPRQDDRGYVSPFGAASPFHKPAGIFLSPALSSTARRRGRRNCAWRFMVPAPAKVFALEANLNLKFLIRIEIEVRIRSQQTRPQKLGSGTGGKGLLWRDPGDADGGWSEEVY